MDVSKLVSAALAKAAALPESPAESTPEAPKQQSTQNADYGETKEPLHFTIPSEVEVIHEGATPPLDLYNSNPANRDLDIIKPIVNSKDDPGPMPEESLSFLSAKFVIPPSPEVPVEEIVKNIPNPRAEPLGEEDNCAHLCESCKEWWSHGAKNKCRHPEILSQGLCMNCLSGAGKTENADPLAEVIEDDRGRKTLSTEYQVKVRNDEREVCKNMDIEQLSFHIQHIYKRELEMRARSSEARKIRGELIDYEAQDIPEAEREAFKQALLLGKKAAKEKRPAKTKLTKVEQKAAIQSKITDDLKKAGVANAQLVAQYMLQIVGARDINDPEIYAKLKAKAEAFVND